MRIPGAGPKSRERGILGRAGLRFAQSPKIGIVLSAPGRILLASPLDPACLRRAPRAAPCGEREGMIQSPNLCPPCDSPLHRRGPPSPRQSAPRYCAGELVALGRLRRLCAGNGGPRGSDRPRGRDQARSTDEMRGSWCADRWARFKNPQCRLAIYHGT